MEKQTLELFRRFLTCLAPPKNLKLSEWADQYRYLPMEGAAEPGRWRTDRAPYQREIMDAISDPRVKRVVVMSAAQIGKTDSCVLNVIGYYMHQDPAPIMVVMPTIGMSESFAKERLVPMLRDTPVLREKIDLESRNSGNTILKKSFPGGYLVLIGANSPASLASRPIRVLLCDEVDRFPPSAGDEGDPLMLAEKRQSTFWNRKEVNISTPTVKGASRIEVEYKNSTQHRWQLPCPVCGAYQELLWPKVVYHEERLSEIGMACEHCGAVSSEAAWKAQQKALKGKYAAKYPGRAVKGFHINALCSPWMGWQEIAEEFIKANEQAKMGNLTFLKTWINTVLGETWEDRGEQVSENALLERRELYRCTVPRPVLVLTAGVDVQDDRLECEVVGWCPDKESYGIQYAKFFGSPQEEAVWKQLDAFLSQPFERQDGQKLYVSCACVDSGGHCSQQVYKFCKGKEARRIFAIKGRGGMGQPFISNPSTSNRYKAPLFMIGVDGGKDMLYSRLNVPQPGGGYCHFPLEPEKGYGKEYFEMLTAEKRVVTYNKKTGRACFAWVLKKQGSRNEALDVRNYATAALEIFNPRLSELPTEKKKKKRTGVLNKGL